MSKLKLLLDVSALGYGFLGVRHRTGLFRVAVAYAQHLQKNKDVELGLYSSSGNRVFAQRLLDSLGWRNQRWVGDPWISLWLFGLQSVEFVLYRSPLRALSKPVSRWKEQVSELRKHIDRRALSTWQAYLSPMESVPSEIRGIPSLVTGILVHDLIPLRLPDYRQSSDDPTRWFSRMWRSTRETDLVFAVSEATRRDWLQLRPESNPSLVVVASNAVDRSRFLPGQGGGQEGRFFFALTTTEPRKRLGSLLAGYARYRKEGGTLPLRIGGAGQGQTLPMAEGVEYLGFIREDRLPDFYRGCTAFISLSEYEGFGLPVLEAMSCGTPVIVSDRSSHPEVAGEAGLYVNPDSPEELSEALRRVTEPAVRNACVRLSLSQAARFSWERTIARVVESFRAEIDRRQSDVAHE